MSSVILSFPTNSPQPEHEQALTQFRKSEIYLLMLATPGNGLYSTALDAAYLKGWQDALKYVSENLAKQFAV